jgi:SOS response regulatory protein OraA/RecX
VGAAEPGQRDEVMERAGRELSRRAHSEASLRQRLLGLGEPAVVEGVLGDLRRLGFVDDRRLALAVAEQCLGQGWGTARVAADLERLRIDGDDRRAALEAAEAREGEAARALALRRGHALGPGRLWSLLARRGFSEDAARGALEGLGVEECP